MTLAEQSPPPDIPVENPGPRGIGGWLILPILGLAFTILMTTINLIQGFGTFTGETYEVLRNQFPDILAAVVVSTVAGIGCIVLAVYCLWLIFNHDHRTPKWMVAFYLVILVVTLFETALTYHMADSFQDPSMTEGVGRDVMRAIVGSAIWIPYFNASKRVKNTFVR